MRVYAAEKCDCIYESGFDVIRLHATKAGAYKDCRKWWLEEWNNWNHDLRGDGFHGGMSAKKRRRDHDTATHSKRWRVKEYDVVPDNA